MPELLVLEHTAAAGPSAFTEVLDSRTSLVPWRSVDVPAGEALPDHLDDVAGLLVLGGTMSAVDRRTHGWMPRELEILERAVAHEVPVFGVCLGAQLLGEALGGDVRPRAVPEVGFLALTRTAAGRDDEVVSGWPDGARVAFVHEDEVSTLPPGAVSLLTGSDGEAAWRLGSALAVQFHPEATGDQLAGWLDSGLLDHVLERAGCDPAVFADEARRRERFVVPLGQALFGRFVDGPVRDRVAAMQG